MNRLFLVSALLLSIPAPTILAAPASRAKLAAKAPAAPTLKREVRARMPRGAKSVRLIRGPVGVAGARTLIHLWSIRLSTAPGEAVEALYCVDVFEAGQGARRWELANSESFLGTSFYGPPQISARWLRPARKESVLVIVDLPTPGGQRYKFITFPDKESWPGVGSSVVQEFAAGGPGGPTMSSLGLGLDETGTTTVEVTIVHKSTAPPEVRIARWTVHGFVMPPRDE